MTSISHRATLFWYDGPQVFEARDPIGGHYVAVAIEEPPGTSRYLVVGVAPEELRRLRSGIVDLRSVLLDASGERWYLTSADADPSGALGIAQQTGALAETEFLPEAGFFLHSNLTDDSTLVESRQRNRLVVELVTEPPEAADEHRIRLETLVDILGGVQTMVKHAYGVAWRGLSKDYRSILDKGAEPLLDVVVPAAPGSFRVLLEAAQMPNLIGESEVARALRRVDALFEHVADADRALDTVRGYKGHLAGAYLRLMRLLADRDTCLRYSWAEPAAADVVHRGVTAAEAVRLVPLLTDVANLSTESVSLVGEFERFHRKTGLWGLLTEGGKVSGKIRDDGPRLDGLRVGGRYRFWCVEEIELIRGTGREKRTLYLTSHEPA